MAIIKLTKLNSVWNENTKKYEDTPNTTILFNTNELITAETTKNGFTHIKYKEAMVNGFCCVESLDEIYKLSNKK